MTDMCVHNILLLEYDPVAVLVHHSSTPGWPEVVSFFSLRDHQGTRSITFLSEKTAWVGYH